MLLFLPNLLQFHGAVFNHFKVPFLPLCLDTRKTKSQSRNAEPQPAADTTQVRETLSNRSGPRASPQQRVTRESSTAHVTVGFDDMYEQIYTTENSQNTERSTLMTLYSHVAVYLLHDIGDRKNSPSSKFSFPCCECFHFGEFASQFCQSQLPYVRFILCRYVIYCQSHSFSFLSAALTFPGLRTLGLDILALTVMK